MRLLGVLAGVCLTISVFADEGLPSFKWTLLDQRDEAYTLDDNARLVLIARSMSAAKLLNAAMEDCPVGYLEARHVVYVADIQKMPSLIKLVAVPAMRSASYRIMLDQDGRVATRYGGDRDTVQWLALKNGVVIHEERFADAVKLKKAVADLPQP